MRKRVLVWLLVLWVVLGVSRAYAQQAMDITGGCIVTAHIKSAETALATDGKYKTWFSSGLGAQAYLDIQLPEGEQAGGIVLKWAKPASAVCVQVAEDGQYTTIATSDTAFLADYIELPEGVTAFRVALRDKPRERLHISELQVYSRGELPESVQRWAPAWPKADLLVLSTHPDDELIFLGGTIPYYARERGIAVQVAYAVSASPERRLELLDGLWLCGVRNYPVLGNFANRFSYKKKEIQTAWGKARFDRFVIGLYREFRPEVVVTQDLQGEYGHGAHKAVADAALRAVAMAADAKYEAKMARDLGIWQVKKLYLHLYPENPIQMDWRVPLPSFGGRTALEVAQEAFLCHVSQQRGVYFVEDSGPYDNSLFGLYHTTVGPDVQGGDFFEHVPHGMRQ